MTNSRFLAALLVPAWVVARNGPSFLLRNSTTLGTGRCLCSNCSGDVLAAAEGEGAYRDGQQLETMLGTAGFRAASERSRKRVSIRLLSPMACSSGSTPRISAHS